MTEKNPLVTVIMPTYNHAKFIKEAIDSVLHQTYTNFELIIINNYSEDNTESIVKLYNDNRIKYIKFRNNGIIAASRNVGIKNSNGEYIAFLDSDDLWLPDKLTIQVKFMDEHPQFALVYAQVEVFGKRKVSDIVIPHPQYALQGSIFNELLARNLIGVLTVLVRKRCLDEIGYFDEDPSLKSVEDYELWLRISQKYQVGFIDKVLAKYRIHPLSISGNLLKSRAYSLNALHKIDDKIGIPIPLKGKVLGKVHREIAKEYLLLKDYPNALKEIKISRDYSKGFSEVLYPIMIVIGLGFLLRSSIVISRQLKKLMRYRLEKLRIFSK